MNARFLAKLGYPPDKGSADQKDAAGQAELGEQLKDEVMRVIGYFFGYVCRQRSGQEEMIPCKTLEAHTRKQGLLEHEQ